ncbi:hypothetical protein COY05_03675 [Candidatus Peregrinibacteria bacterium CG_4_10_14_0_2_um_filter_38_24]|nr:MAG: hypothetical protein COY05_03675 [Candidatus Peregrinibacteria bacterium CG_4_10_14_0_2_um_filter_38_24]PJC39394.1 MAG: hypothetical protein CO044_00055 [Candidatus Peregrinibacteria bacterium CG_4_9_14_0_2_um_filter_38_9]
MKKFSIFTWSIIVVIFFPLVLGLFYFVGVPRFRDYIEYNTGDNAVWAGHEWVEEGKTFYEIKNFVDNLRKHQISNVFLHVGPILENGQIEQKSYVYSSYFLRQAKGINSNIKYQAWLGQIRGKLDLDDENIRRNVANQCRVLAQFIGFDGIHFDIEPMSDDDSGFIKLLEECKQNMSEEKVLSVALPDIIPESFLWYTQNVLKFDNVNSEINYKNVAKYADEIVVMLYDTKLRSDWLYKKFIVEEVSRITSLLKNRKIYFGIPAYEKGSENFDPKIENVKNGILGVIMGLDNARSNLDSFAGIAIYPYWEISDDEWKTFNKLWLNKNDYVD